MTIIDNFKKSLGEPIIDKSQFLKAISIIDESQFLSAISIIDKLSSINFSNKCCGKFLMCLTKFFLQAKLQKRFSRFFKKREQFADSAVALNKTERDFC